MFAIERVHFEIKNQIRRGIMKKGTIFIVDDNIRNIKVLGALLGEQDYEIAFTQDSRKALPFAIKQQPDVILLDVMMPHLDGYDVCKQLKENENTKNIPVVFLTAKSDKEDITRGFQVGGVDYVSKPFNTDELFARIQTHISLNHSNRQLADANRELKEYSKKLEEINQELAKAMEQMEILASTDPLTGLFNRRYILERLDEEKNRQERYGRNFSLIMGDLDHFKKFNDKYGHECGDAILVNATNILRRELRKQDIAARWGGEEFLILLPETPFDEAVVVAERIRKEIDESPMAYNDENIYMTITLGVCEYIQESGIQKTIKQVDNALYQGKQEGRNRVIASTITP